MPLFDYLCVCGVRVEHLVPNVETPMACTCGQPMRPETVVRFAVVGPVSSGLEDMERAVLGQKAMAGGQRFNSAADIERWERAQGVQRSSQEEIRQMHERNADEAAQLQRVEQERGTQGVADLVLKDAITEKTGWSDSQYQSWKEHSDVAQRAAEVDQSLIA